ncbi:glycosyltransferase family 39 protein [Streptomyces sp. NPDC051597]|uniref:glycosyltransferase family 39 protein n=1 Tax=Streptomyces sp. NPDC051597 TaxID=3155049 RepID=UPI0034343A0C
MLLHIALRLAGIGVVGVWGHRKGLGLHEVLATRWDSVFYLNIAQHGYTSPMVPGCGLGGPTCKLAFFPFYPALIRGTSAVTGLPAGWSAWLVALAASLLAAWGIFAVAEKLYDARVALFAVALYAVVPHALVQSMAYTEPVFTALAAWALYAVLCRAWLTAGALALLAGATRPSGLAVIAAVALGAAWQLLPAGGRRTPQLLPARGRRAPRRPTARLYGAIALAPLGWAAFVVWVGRRMGSWDGYFVEQRQWGSTFDGGVFTAQRLRDLFTLPTLTLDYVVAAATVVTAVILLAVLALRRPPLVIWVYAGALVLIAVGGAGFFHAKARFLLPAFPLLFPLAIAMARARRTTVWCTLTGAALASAFYSGYLTMVWTHSP